MKLIKSLALSISTPVVAVAPTGLLATHLNQDLKWDSGKEKQTVSDFVGNSTSFSVSTKTEDWNKVGIDAIEWAWCEASNFNNETHPFSQSFSKLPCKISTTLQAIKALATSGEEVTVGTSSTDQFQMIIDQQAIADLWNLSSLKNNRTTWRGATGQFGLGNYGSVGNADLQIYDIGNPQYDDNKFNEIQDRVDRCKMGGQASDVVSSLKYFSSLNSSGCAEWDVRSRQNMGNDQACHKQVQDTSNYLTNTLIFSIDPAAFNVKVVEKPDLTYDIILKQNPNHNNPFHVFYFCFINAACHWTKVCDGNNIYTGYISHCYIDWNGTSHFESGESNKLSWHRGKEAGFLGGNYGDAWIKFNNSLGISMSSNNQYLCNFKPNNPLVEK